MIARTLSNVKRKERFQRSFKCLGMLCDRVTLPNIPPNRPKPGQLTVTDSEHVCGYANPKVRDAMRSKEN